MGTFLLVNARGYGDYHTARLRRHRLSLLLSVRRYRLGRDHSQQHQVDALRQADSGAEACAADRDGKARPDGLCPDRSVAGRTHCFTNGYIVCHCHWLLILLLWQQAVKMAWDCSSIDRKAAIVPKKYVWHCFHQTTWRGGFGGRKNVCFVQRNFV